LGGNGRTFWLKLHTVLHQLTGGLWSANRALAGQRKQYYVRLAEADMARQGELDSHGNLSEKALQNWCAFFIDVCADQVSFMSQMLELHST